MVLEKVFPQGRRDVWICLDVAVGYGLAGITMLLGLPAVNIITVSLAVILPAIVILTWWKPRQQQKQKPGGP